MQKSDLTSNSALRNWLLIKSGPLGFLVPLVQKVVQQLDESGGESTWTNQFFWDNDGCNRRCVLAQNITPKNKHYVSVGQGLNRVVCTDGTEKWNGQT